jgi:hypothetical protein
MLTVWHSLMSREIALQPRERTSGESRAARTGSGQNRRHIDEKAPFPPFRSVPNRRSARQAFSRSNLCSLKIDRGPNGERQGVRRQESSSLFPASGNQVFWLDSRSHGNPAFRAGLDSRVRGNDGR